MDLFMPKLGASMVEGSVAEWLADDGTVVVEGDPIYIIETDKTETETEMVAPIAGTLRHVAQLGESVPCGTKIAELA